MNFGEIRCRKYYLSYYQIFAFLSSWYKILRKSYTVIVSKYVSWHTEHLFYRQNTQNFLWQNLLFKIHLLKKIAKRVDLRREKFLNKYFTFDIRKDKI